jgi:FtsP/CotA-like multicopper oxidase with cupredoxin domain
MTEYGAVGLECAGSLEGGGESSSGIFFQRPEAGVRPLLGRWLAVCTLSGGLILLLFSLFHGTNRPQHHGSDLFYDEPSSWSQLLLAANPSHLSSNLQQPEMRHSTDGLLRTVLKVQGSLMTPGPIDYYGRTYDGLSPGPTLMLDPGDTLQLTLENALGESPTGTILNYTNLHTHGLHISPSDQADNIYRVAAPGMSLDYQYDIPEDHDAGTYYYHPHLQGSSNLQMAGGMAGALIVRDYEAHLPAEMKNLEEHVMVLQDVDVERMEREERAILGSKVAVLAHRNEASAPARFVTVNGQFQPILGLEVGKIVRLRMIHGGSNLFLRLVVHGGSCSMVTVARDGAYLSEPRQDAAILMAPGSRADALLLCAEPGTYRLISEEAADVSLYLGERTEVLSGSTLAFLHVSGAASTTSGTAAGMPTWLPVTDRTTRIRNLQYASVDSSARWVFEYGTNGKVERDGRVFEEYTINGRPYSENLIQRTVALGAVEEWVIVNTLPSQHPYHQHVNHFVIVASSMGDEGPDWRVGDVRETITIPTPGNVTIRWIADDYVGKSVAHCHLPAHSDNGMIANFEII